MPVPRIIILFPRRFALELHMSDICMQKAHMPKSSVKCSAIAEENTEDFSSAAFDMDATAPFAVFSAVFGGKCGTQYGYNHIICRIFGLFWQKMRHSIRL